jgi:N-acetylneuraminic acid mutarotase
MIASVLAIFFARPSEIVGHVAGKIGDLIVVAGGWAEQSRWPGSSVWIYSLGSQAWREGSPMPSGYGFSASAIHGGGLVVIGGVDSWGQHSKKVLQFQPTTGWKKLPSLPFPVSRAAACSWNGKLYVSGGFNGEYDAGAQNSPALLVLEPASKSWRRLASMPTPRHAHRLVAFQGRLWAIGGFGSSEEHGRLVESYDPKSNSWRSELKLTYSRGFFGAEVISGKLILFGGAYNPAHTQEWSSKGWIDRKATDVPRRRFAYVRIGSDVLIIGGEPVGKLTMRFAP